MSQRGSWQALPQEVHDLIYQNCIIACHTAIKHPELIDQTPYQDTCPSYARLSSIAVASKKDYFDFFNVCQGLTIHEITLNVDTEFSNSLLRHHPLAFFDAHTATHLSVHLTLDAWAEEPQPVNVQCSLSPYLTNRSSLYPLDFSSYYNRPPTIGGRSTLSPYLFANGASGPNPQHRLIQPHSRIFEQVLHAFPNISYLAVDIGGNQPLTAVRQYEAGHIHRWAQGVMFTANQRYSYESYSLIVAPGHPDAVANWTSGAGGRFKAELGREGQDYGEWLEFLDEMGADRNLRKILKKKQDDEFGRSKVPLRETQEEEVVEQGGDLVVRLPCMTGGRWVEEDFRNLADMMMKKRKVEVFQSKVPLRKLQEEEEVEQREAPVVRLPVTTSVSRIEAATSTSTPQPDPGVVIRLPGGGWGGCRAHISRPRSPQAQ